MRPLVRTSGTFRIRSRTSVDIRFVPLVGLGVIFSLAILAWTSKLDPLSNRETATARNRSNLSTRFREVGREAGLDYKWEIAGKRPLDILQTVGNGCAFLDYDQDGSLDALMIGPRLALYRGDGAGRFRDVSASLGIDKLKGHFLGCAVGDYDNDGWPDLYVSGYRTGLLLRNEETSDGSRRFRDVTREMGIPSQAWGTSSGFADLNEDGFLDLYVCNYVSFDPKKDPRLWPYKGVLTGCGPRDYDPIKGRLYQNEAGRGFRDITRACGVTGTGKGLGVAFADYQSSGQLGFAVANDLMEGDLFQNSPSNKFQNVGRKSGTALDELGDVHGGMGIDWGDYDNDGRFDLFVTTFANETKSLYRNEGSGVFAIASDRAGLMASMLTPMVSWGCKFFDADNDGWLDLLVANGHVQDNVEELKEGVYRQPLQFMQNRAGAYTEETGSVGIGELPYIVGRGLAIGDYDNDGRIDALVVDSEGRPLLLHNESGSARDHWIGFRLIGDKKRGLDAYGAVVEVEAGGKRLIRQCHPGGSYLSSSDPRVHFGLGTGKLESVTVKWPDGTARTWRDLAPGRYWTLRQVE